VYFSRSQRDAKDVLVVATLVLAKIETMYVDSLSSNVGLHYIVQNYIYASWEKLLIRRVCQGGSPPLSVFMAKAQPYTTKDTYPQC